MKKNVAVSVLLAALFVLVALHASADGSKLTPGDVVSVTVDNEKDFTKNYEVGKNGTVILPQVGEVRVENLNTSDAAAEITRSLAKVLVNPQVTVSYVDGAKMQVFVVGQVKSPGLATIGVGEKVLQAIAQAGYDDTADLSHINIRRGDQIIDLDLKKYLSAEDLTQNAELQSGDTVVVPRSDSVGMVNVLGQATKVGPVSIRKGMTFRELMGLIGDVTVQADTDKITIKHEGSSEQTSVNYKRAMDGDPAADVVLQAGDTVYVPEIETAFFTVMGGVSSPGPYPLKGKLTLTEAIGRAGGVAPNIGDQRKVQVLRPGETGKPSEVMNMDLTQIISQGMQDPLVKRGDVIYVAVHKSKTNVWDVFRTVLPFGWIFK